MRRREGAGGETYVLAEDRNCFALLPVGYGLEFVIVFQIGEGNGGLLSMHAFGVGDEGGTRSLPCGRAAIGIILPLHGCFALPVAPWWRC